MFDHHLYLFLAANQTKQALIDAPGQGEQVVGELYEIDAATFSFIHDNKMRHRGLYAPMSVAVEPVASSSESAAAALSAPAAIEATTFVLSPRKAAAALAAAAESQRLTGRSPFLQRYDKSYVLF